MNCREFFDSVAYKWDSMCYHDDEKLKKIINLSQVEEGANILDVGTGTGVLIKYLLETSPNKITAIDVSKNMIKVAESKYNNEKVEFVAGDVLEYDKSFFDYIFLYSVYPHLDDKNALFKHLRHLLEDGGRLIIAHSESRDKINAIHKRNEIVKKDTLPPAEETAKILAKYLDVEITIDNDELYYISAIKA